MSIGGNIRIRREAKGLTQTELGRLISCNQDEVSRIENNKRTLSIDTAMKIAKALGCGIEELAITDNKTIQWKVCQ